MRIANCNDKLLQKNSLDSFLVIADELIVKTSMGEDNMKPKKKGNSLKTNSEVRRGALNPNKGQNNLPIFMCDKITLLKNKTILPQIRSYHVHDQLTSQEKNPDSTFATIYHCNLQFSFFHDTKLG